MTYNPKDINQLQFNREYRNAVDGNFKDAAASINALLTEISKLNSRLNGVVLEPDAATDPEVIAARTARDGTVYASLYDHTDAIEADLESNTSDLVGVKDYQTLLKASLDIESSTDLVYYVNGATGNDTDTGSSAAPFKTIQKALNSIPLLTVGGSTTINIADGVYSENLTLKNKFGGAIYIVGNTDVPSNVKISSIRCTDIYAYLNISGIRSTTAIESQFFYDRCSYVNTNRCEAVDDNKTAGTYGGIVYFSSNGAVSGTVTSNGHSGVWINYNSQVTVESSCTGSNNVFGVHCGRSIVHKFGSHTIVGTTANDNFYNGGIISNGGIIG